MCGCAWVLLGAAQGYSRGPRNGECAAVQGRDVQLRRGAAWGCAGAQLGAGHGPGVGLCKATACGCTVAQRAAAHGRGVRPHRGAACGFVGAQYRTAQRRSMWLRGRSIGPRKNATHGCALVHGAAEGYSVG